MRFPRTRRPLLPLLLAAAGLIACAGSGEEARARDVLLATTTSVEDSGLLEALAGPMRARLGDVRVRVVAVGSGQALELARRGDADLVLVHDPAAEAAFVAAGHGDARRTIMRNDFVVVGPPDDPADALAAPDPLEALRRIARAGALFVSRGDSSGTHRKERELWRQAGRLPEGAWYREAGLGQADLLRMASERGAYALTDRGTFRYLEARLHLIVVQPHGVMLDNPYSVLVATRARNPDGARAVADWLAGPEAHAIIASYGADRFGTPLFEALP